jgi:hypothetical protein
LAIRRELINLALEPGDLLLRSSTIDLKLGLAWALSTDATSQARQARLLLPE